MACSQALLTPIGNGTRAVVVGGGHSGQAAAKLLHSLGAGVRLLEKKLEKLPANFTAWAEANHVFLQGGEHKREHFMGAHVVVLSPGVAVASIKPLLLEVGGPEVLAETELAWRQLEGEPVLGITGTSGKTTTTSLCAAMLEAQGLNVFTGGNIGVPLSEYVLERKRGTREKADVVVLELSSFQLQTCNTLTPRVAMLLNISENHLDYHADMREYVSAKMRLFRCQEAEDLAIFGESLRGLPTHYKVEARKVYFNPHSTRFTDMQLFGPHNQANAEAAWQACKAFGVSLENAKAAVAAFQPLPHRLEKVAEINNVLYINDSKCTTVEALNVALTAMNRPTWLLAGGKFKGGDLASLVPLLQEKARGVALYGGFRQAFEDAWKQALPVSYDNTLREALARVNTQVQEGEVVLLAPTTASYDQYPDYLARGEDFRSAVLEHAPSAR